MAIKQVAAGSMGTASIGTRAQDASAFTKARTFFVAACDRINHEVAVRSAVKDLEQLDDRALRDIGIQRCDIEYFARNGGRQYTR